MVVPGVPLRVLMVAGDMPSHPVAVAKFALCLADAGHDVTFAVPAGDPVGIAERAVKNSTRIRVVATGHTTTTEQLNAHGSSDAKSWGYMLESLKHPIPEMMADAADLTAPMFGPLLDLMQKDPRPDVVVLSHYMWSAGGDAAEVAGIPAVTFVHIPYDPAIFLGEEWGHQYPRMLPSLPHVAAYRTVRPAGLRGWLQLAWKRIDARISAAAWSRAARRQNVLRLSRGLQPTATGGWAGYLANHPAVVLGGPPFGPPAPVPPLVAVVGDVEPENSEQLPEQVAKWLAEAGSQGIVFISMGTGMTLNEAEAREIAGGLGRRLAGNGGPRLLWSLRSSEQDRLRTVIQEELGTKVVALSDGTFSYQGDTVRIASYLPQVGVLNSGCVSLFLSHMGFGACTEGVKAGCAFLTYPGGFDQEFNATRAEEGGFAWRVPAGLSGLEGITRRALVHDVLHKQARKAKRQLLLAGGAASAVQAVEKFAAMGRDDAEALTLPFPTHSEAPFVASVSAVAFGTSALALGVLLVKSMLFCSKGATFCGTTIKQ